MNGLGQLENGGSILREVALILYNMGGTFLEGYNTCFGALEVGQQMFCH